MPDPTLAHLAEAPGRPPINLRWSWTDLSFSLSERKLVIARRSRPELAHLTVGWGNVSGEVDFHLTFGHEAAMSGQAEKDRKPLFVVTREMLEVAGQVSDAVQQRDMMPFLARHYRRYRPGWLARKGYVVLVAGQEEFRRLLDQVAPWQRKKYRVDLRKLVATEVHRELVAEGLFSPEVLSLPECAELLRGPGNIPLPVGAIRVRQGRVSRRHGIQLRYGPDLKGRMGWCGVMNGPMSKLMNRISWQFYEWLVPRVGPPHAEVFERLVAGLALDELDDLRHALDTIRRFMRAPKNPLPGPPARALLLLPGR